MSFTEDITNGATFAHDRKLSAERRSRAAKALFIGAGALGLLSRLFTTQHPIAAVWIALMLIGWLFIAAAAKASEE
jgi:hypothetical protein